MKYASLVLLVVMPLISVGQQAAQAIEPGPMKLQDRYALMKEKSQTYNDYKVIKHNVLDGFWRLTMDSIRDQRQRITEGLAKISTLETEIKQLQATIVEKDSVLAEMEYDGTHIRVLGIDAHKTAFTSVVGFIVLGLIILVGLLFVRMRYVSSDNKERKEQVDVLTREYEEYKRGALDKQMKLSRELQDERNKLAELGHS